MLTHFAPALRLGLTATPERLDRKGLGKTFEVAPYVYELKDAIRDQWLVPIRQRMAFIEGLDLSKCRVTAGDLNEGDVERVMIDAAVVHGVAKATVEAAGERKTLVFATTIAHAKILAEAMGRYTDPSRVLALSGQDPVEVRREGLRRFSRGEIQYLFNVALFSEGFDEPEISCVVTARPTASKSLYAQQVGRGTRLAPSKKDLVVLDFAGNAGRHSLVNVMDVLGGAEDPEIRRRVAKRLEQGEADVIEAIDEAQRELAEFHRRQAMEQARRAAEVARVRYVDIDPFAILGVSPARGGMAGAEPTATQLDVLREYKVDKDMRLDTLDRRQAQQLINAIRNRPRKGYCTYKQARVLLRAGLNPDLSFEDARAAMDLLSSNRWKPTAECLTRFGKLAAPSTGAVPRSA